MTKLVWLDAEQCGVRAWLSQVVESTPDLGFFDATQRTSIAGLAQGPSVPDVAVWYVDDLVGPGRSLPPQPAARFPGVPVVLLAELRGQQWPNYLAQADVDGWVATADGKHELTSALCAVSRRDGEFASRSLGRCLLRTTHRWGRRTAVVDGAPLTSSELRIVRLFGRGMEVCEVGRLLCVSEQTVYMHRRNAMEKLGVTGVAKFQRLAVLWSALNSREEPCDRIAAAVPNT